MSESQKVELNGKELSCKHCGYDHFLISRAQLNTSGMTLLGLDFLNKSASVFICNECGYVHWFLGVGDNDTVHWG
jgi:rubrerythrin